MGSFPGLRNPFTQNLPWPVAVIAEGTLSANSPSFPILSFSPMNSILLFISVSGYAGTDVVSLQFNGDTAANYWSRYLTAAQGTTTLVNTENVGATAIACGLAINKGRAVMVQVVNAVAKSKVAQIMNQFGSGTSATASTATLSGQGEWINTTAPITSILMTTVGGLSMTSGSSFQLIGWNAP
jgi:hypothetical protein